MILINKLDQAVSLVMLGVASASGTRASSLVF